VRLSALRVDAFTSLSDLGSWGRDVDALNLASRRPSPFHTIEYLKAFLSSDEYEAPGATPLLLLAREDERLVGFLPLRRRPERIFGLPCTRIEFLTTHDTERPALLARPEDEVRCAEAFLRHLAEREKGWSFLELLEQDASSPFLAFPGLPRERYHGRHFPNNPSATVHLDEPTFEEWFHRLDRERSKRIKYKLASPARELLAAGQAEFVACEGRAVGTELLDVYLDLEARSWKAKAKAGVGRHPRRVALFRRMLQLEVCDPPVFHLLLLDGVPIAGMFSLVFHGTAYQMETVFDADFAPYAPGNLVFLLAVRDAVANSIHAYNLLTNFAYHKSRWGATITDTAAIQIYRRGGLHHVKAVLGELKRRWWGARLQQNEAKRNLTKKREGARTDPPENDAPLTPRAGTTDAHAAAQVNTARVLPEVERHGRLTRLSGDALVAALPFDVRSASKPRTDRAPGSPSVKPSPEAPTPSSKP
jgi:CelD/BcsL family acetyltransferase involved in cellulose biosynthesis